MELLFYYEVELGHLTMILIQQHFFTISDLFLPRLQTYRILNKSLTRDQAFFLTPVMSMLFSVSANRDLMYSLGHPLQSQFSFRLVTSGAVRTYRHYHRSRCVFNQSENHEQFLLENLDETRIFVYVRLTLHDSIRSVGSN